MRVRVWVECDYECLSGLCTRKLYDNALVCAFILDIVQQVYKNLKGII